MYEKLAALDYLQLEVLDLASWGYTDAKIAEFMHSTDAQIKLIISSIKQILKVTSLVSALRFYKKWVEEPIESILINGRRENELYE